MRNECMEIGLDLLLTFRDGVGTHFMNVEAFSAGKVCLYMNSCSLATLSNA